MLKIRLARTGRKKLANYRVVASDSRRTPTAGSVTQLGHYNPHTKELVINAEKTQTYLDNGAQLSSRMVRLLKDRKDIKLPAWAEKSLVVKAEKKKTAEPEATTDEAATTTETAEKPTETDTEAKETAEDNIDNEEAVEQAEAKTQSDKPAEEDPKDKPAAE